MMHQTAQCTAAVPLLGCRQLQLQCTRSRIRRRPLNIASSNVWRAGKRRIRPCHVACTVLILLCACAIPADSFSRPIASSTASTVVRWHSELHSTTSSNSPKVIVSEAAIKGSIAKSLGTSTDEKISQLKDQHAQRKRQQSKGTHKSHQKYQTSKRKRPYHKRKGGKVAERCSRRQNEKRRVRYMYSQARSLEKKGAWREASQLLENILELDPKDAHSYLALARLESRRERGSRVGRTKEETSEAVDSGLETGNAKKFTSASEIFSTGTGHCPDSVHLWHAWGMHEQSLGNVTKARELFEKALEIDPWNGYVCHAYGLLEMQNGSDGEAATADLQEGRVYDAKTEAHQTNRVKKARQLWQRGLTYQPSAALVTSLGDLYLASGHPNSARELYATYVNRMKNERERIEVYLAASSLEETVYGDVERASELLKEALSSGDVADGRAYVALARLGTSGGLVDDAVVKKRLREICTKQTMKGGKRNRAFPVKDGRLFNAWAKLESKSNLREARRILGRGMRMYPKDHTLLQAAGNVEERMGNVTAARDLYGASLHLEPSAPALIAYAMLELRSPEGGEEPNVTMVRKLFDEALLIDPKHGPVYNAYGNLERREGNVERAKQLYEDGINANCTDAPSVYHGLAKMHLSLGEVADARTVLQNGLAHVDAGAAGGRVPHAPQRSENAAFLAHTLAMIELNVHHDATSAKRALERGLLHRRNSPQLLLAMALCESRLGNDDAARDMFEKSIAADQSHAQAWQGFGVMEMRAGNFRTARTLFECGLKHCPTHGALWSAYGTLESWKGNMSKARLLFAAGIEKCPQHVPLYQAWACLELRSGDVLTAKRLIGEALTRDKRNGSGWLVAAKIEEKMDNHGLVGLLLRRGIECAPRDMELYRALADHEISRGKIDSARELLERGIELNPLYAPLYHSLAELEARVFNIEGLAKLNKRTAEIFPSDALAPPPAERVQAWGNKIKQSGRYSKIPDGIAALAEKVGVDATDAGGSLADVDPDSLVNSFGYSEDSGLMFEDISVI